MSPRRAAAVIAAVVLALGFVLAVTPISISAGAEDVGCGTALSPSSTQAGTQDYVDRIGDALAGGPGLADSDYVARCEDRVSTQRLVAYPLMGLAAVVLAFVVLTSQGGTRWDDEDEDDEEESAVETAP